MGEAILVIILLPEPLKVPGFAMKQVQPGLCANPELVPAVLKNDIQLIRAHRPRILFVVLKVSKRPAFLIKQVQSLMNRSNPKILLTILEQVFY